MKLSKLSDTNLHQILGAVVNLVADMEKQEAEGRRIRAGMKKRAAQTQETIESLISLRDELSEILQIHYDDEEEEDDEDEDEEQDEHPDVRAKDPKTLASLQAIHDKAKNLLVRKSYF